ncbi:PAS-domain containing protein [Oricola indica]|uniref:PAS-domain containing protein n=1 Tax=Oricola indica TaxID=2872591 RepID=UPI003CCC14BF
MDMNRADRKERPEFQGLKHRPAKPSDRSPERSMEWLVSGLNLLEQGITIFDADLRLIHANRTFLRLYDLPDEYSAPGTTFEAINRFLAEKGDFGPGDVDGLVRERVERAEAFEDHYLERVRPNGMVIAVEGHALADGGWVAVYTDITSKKNSEALLRERADRLSHSLLERSEQLEATNRELNAANRALEEVSSRLAESESRMRTITHSVPAHIAYIDRDLVYLFSNNKLADMLGFDDLHFQGRRVSELFDPEDLEVLMPAINGALDGRPCSVDFHPRDANGEHRHLRSSLVPERDANGKVTGAHILSIDVTEEKRAMDLIVHSKRMEAAIALTSGVVHDFSNIMTIILGNLNRLSDPALAGGERERILQATRRAVERGGRVTDQLMSFSRNEDLVPTLCNLNRITEDLVRLFAASLDPSTTITVTDREGALGVCMDERAYQDALLNLLLNARDAIGHAGSISVEIARTETGDGPAVTVAVRDDGCGFPDGTIDRACEAFFSTKQGGRGRGLGLSMVRRFLRRSGGGLEIESAPGEGAAITMTLPLAGDVAMEIAAPRDTKRIGARPGGLAVVLDDEAEIRELVRGYLLKADFQVIEASTGGEALELLANLPKVALLVSDIMMPGSTTGIDVAREARALRPDLPCLLISGLATTHPALGEAEREFHLLKKPFGETDFIAALDALFAEALPASAVGA